ncbi:MAG: AAA family ATPase [Oscillospiraceae bacterium]|nr:AAA family ATPase [Oscillospiraceae bacterium]
MEKLKTITCEEIMNTPLEPIEYCVENLIAEGLCILAGAPKIGKSWLSLDICLSIAKGNNVLGQNTKQGTALYLCLEDSMTRLQNRLYEITDEPTEHLHFSIMADTIGNGLEMQIRKFKSAYQDLRIVVIDTLQKVRNCEDSNYGNDYRDLTVIKNLADELKITIILVHHTRKCKDTDPFNMISGSTGLRGCSDGAFVLSVKDKQSYEASLYCEGRDIESREIKLKFNSEQHRWICVADSITQPEKFDDEIITALVSVIQEEKSFYGTPTELTDKINCYTKRSYIANVVSKKILQSKFRLEKQNIIFEMKRTNGTRKIEVKYISADSDDSADKNISAGENTVDPVTNVENTLVSA